MIVLETRHILFQDIFVLEHVTLFLETRICHTYGYPKVVAETLFCQKIERLALYFSMLFDNYSTGMIITESSRVARSSAFCRKLPLFEKVLIHFQLTVFNKQFAKKESFFGKSTTITMQSLQNHWKEIEMEHFLRRSRKDSTYQL